MIETTYEILDLFVYPERETFTNVVGKALLKITFSRNGVSTQGMVEAVLDVTALSQDTFIPVDQVSTDTLANWVIQANGGEEFLSQLKAIHEIELLKRENEIGLVRYEVV